MIQPKLVGALDWFQVESGNPPKLNPYSAPTNLLFPTPLQSRENQLSSKSLVVTAITNGHQFPTSSRPSVEQHNNIYESLSELYLPPTMTSTDQYFFTVGWVHGFHIMNSILPYQPWQLNSTHNLVINQHNA